MSHGGRVQADDDVIVISDDEDFDEVAVIDLTRTEDEIGRQGDIVSRPHGQGRHLLAMHHGARQKADSEPSPTPTACIVDLCSSPLSSPILTTEADYIGRQCLLSPGAFLHTGHCQLSSDPHVLDSTRQIINDVSNRSPHGVMAENSRVSKNKQKRPRKRLDFSSDSDFEDSPVSTEKIRTPTKSRHCHKQPSRKPEMLVTSFPTAHYTGERKAGCNTHASSDSETDLPNPCPFLFDQPRSAAASPILVELYPTFRSFKQEPDTGFVLTPQRRDMGRPGALSGDSMQAAVDQRIPAMACQPRPKEVARKRPLLTSSDFSSSDDDFEVSSQPALQSPRAAKTLQNGPPRKRVIQQASQGPRCRQPHYLGVPVHVGIHETECDTSSMEVDQSLPRTGMSSVGSLSDDSSDIWDFSQRQRHLIAAVVEEDFRDDAIMFIRDFATLHRGAPAEYMMYLLEKVLLADNVEEHTVLSAYDALLYIHSLHPSTMATLTLDWDLIITIIKKLDLETPVVAVPTPCLAHILALQFILVVLTDDLQTAKRKKMDKKSYVHSLLSADMRLGHVRSVVHWICLVITNKLGQHPLKPKPQPKPLDQDKSEDRNIWQFMQQLSEKTAEPQSDSPEDESWSVPQAQSYYTVLELLQRFLRLSVSIGMNYSAVKIAEELVCPYFRIPSLEQRRICLQTLTCDLIRSKLIDLLLENLCEVGDRHGVLSVRKIVEGYFRSERVWSSRTEQTQGLSAPTESAGGLPDSKTPEIQQERDRCEELAMLLLFLLQSYIRKRTAKWRYAGSSDMRSAVPSETSLPSLASQSTLSIEDRECLRQMGDHVEALERRLRAHCTSLTARTRLYLAQMDSMRELAH